MRTLAFISSKGGTGKTTLAALTAVEAARAGEKVALLDFDPQGSLTTWWERRPDAENPHLFMNADPQDLPRAIAHIAGLGFSILVIDGPPAFVATLSSIASFADLVVIPVMASPMDIEGIDPAVQIACRHKRPFVFVLNRVNPKAGPLLEGTIAALQQEGRIVDVQMLDRLAHAGAMSEGKAACEVDRASQKEATKLWAALKAELAEATPPPVRRATSIR